jgi:E3 ubiquitin-protein ligase UBR4
LVLTKQGKINYKVSVDLLLEAISKDLTIVNVNWLPGSQSTLAIGTRDFIKIYDLSEDTISPTHNIMIFNGFISDFTFSSH